MIRRSWNTARLASVRPVDVATDSELLPPLAGISPHEPPQHALASLARRTRGRHVLVGDLIAVSLATILALALRYDGIPGDLVARFAPILPLMLVARIGCNIWLGLYSRSWRQASVPDLVHIVGAILLGSTLAIAAFYAIGAAIGDDWLPGFPRSFWVIEALLSAALLGGGRLSIRVATDMTLVDDGHASRSRPALLYGAGRSGALLARSARRDPAAGVRPVGFLDDDPTLAGTTVAGLRVFGGMDALASAIRHTGATSMLITMPSASGEAIRRVVHAATDQGLDVRTVPPLEDLLDGSLDAYRIRRVRVEDLLRRPMVTEHAVDVRQIITGKTVMVTGAGGSIGSELVRQVFSFDPRRLILVDRAESPLYLMQRELEARRRNRKGSGEVRAHLGNVASREPMSRLVEAEKPDIIFHAAAYKHVPMMEEHPSDAVHVNVLGTKVLLDAAEAAGVGRFVFVSTDKAVHPSSAMGASKRIAEMLVAQAAARTGRPYLSVRFGNVLGSNGSVVPIFQDQLENGEPITITHPDMTRFFMTIPEAAWLILDAATMGTGGDLFVLDMGEPVRILDLARDLVRLSGRDPDSHPVVVTGLRPGEKLNEELFYDRERAQATAAPKVLRVATDAPPATLDADIRTLVAMATSMEEHQLRIALMEYARSLAVPAETLEAAASTPLDRQAPARSRELVPVPSASNLLDYDGAIGPPLLAHANP